MLFACLFVCLLSVHLLCFYFVLFHFVYLSNDSFLLRIVNLRVCRISCPALDILCARTPVLQDQSVDPGIVNF